MVFTEKGLLIYNPSEQGLKPININRLYVEVITSHL